MQCALPLAKDASLKCVLGKDISVLDVEKQEKMAICDSQRTQIATCSPEIQRLYSLNYLAFLSPQAFVKLNANNNVTEFSESFMDKIRSYKAAEEYTGLSFKFPYPTWSAVSLVQVEAHNDTIYLCTINTTSTGMVLFDSDSLTISASWVLENKTRVRFESFDLTFKYSSKYPAYKRTLNFQNENGPVIDW